VVSYVYSLYDFSSLGEVFWGNVLTEAAVMDIISFGLLNRFG
jgi:hypothetical protein